MRLILFVAALVRLLGAASTIRNISNDDITQNVFSYLSLTDQLLLLPAVSLLFQSSARRFQQKHMPELSKLEEYIQSIRRECWSAGALSNISAIHEKLVFDDAFTLK